jgi:alkylation response protein AidB-like acyl-CoA dehydrogenase
MGQRQTDSGSISFRNVLVIEDEVLASLGPSGSPFATLRTCIAQLNKANIYLSIAQGAFEEAKRYTTTRTKPWLTSGVDRHLHPP